MPWQLIRTFEAMQDLSIGFPKFAPHWFFDDVASFEPFDNITKLNLQSPSLLPFIKDINASFPNLTHLRLFIAKKADLLATRHWKAPACLQSLIIDSHNFDQEKIDDNMLRVIDHDTKTRHNLRKFEWLLRLPDSVHTLHLRCYFKYKAVYHQPNVTKLRWPARLTYVTIGTMDFAGEIEPQAKFFEDVANDEHADEPVLSRAEYAKAARAAKKAQQELEAVGESSTPMPPPTAHQKECAPYLELPASVLTIAIAAASGMASAMPSPEPDSLPPRLRSLRAVGPHYNVMGVMYGVHDFYRARPSLQSFAWSQQDSCTLYNGGQMIANLQALKDVPCYAQTMSVALNSRWITISNFTKTLPPSATDMDITHEPKPDDRDSGPPTETIPALPSRLRTLRLYLKDAINIRLPPKLTHLEVNDKGRLKTATVFPPTTTLLILRSSLPA